MRTGELADAVGTTTKAARCDEELWPAARRRAVRLTLAPAALMLVLTALTTHPGA